MCRKLYIRGKLIARLTFAAALLLIACPAVRAGDTILVLKSRELPQYTEAVNGFMQQWKQSGAALQVRQAVLKTAADDAKGVFGGDTEPVAVVAVGTDAAKWAIKNTRGPVVFCMVAKAQQNLLAGLGKEDAARVCGVSLDIPMKTQFEQLRALLPDARRIGVLYDPQKSGIAVKEASQAASELGLELVAREITKESLLPEATEAIAGQIDLLWAPLDSTVFNTKSAEFVLRQMLQRHVPVMGFSENMVEAGALLSPRIDYSVIGEQTAELLATALNKGSSVTVMVQTPRSLDWVVNARINKLLAKIITPTAAQKVSFINEN
jgi:putative ABC transport system substrate-binding protein